MKNELIENSRLRARAGCNYLLETFCQLEITNNEVIRQCHIGRALFFEMKKGKPVKLDVYLRLRDYAIQCLRQRLMEKHRPPGEEAEWKERLQKISVHYPNEWVDFG